MPSEYDTKIIELENDEAEKFSRRVEKGYNELLDILENRRELMLFFMRSYCDGPEWYRYIMYNELPEMDINAVYHDMLDRDSEEVFDNPESALRKYLDLD